MKPSKAPWTRHEVAVHDANDRLVAICFGRTTEEAEGNTQLSSIAPEMLKTIESLLAVLDVYIAYNTYFPLGDGIVSEALRDAREVAKRAGSDDYGEEYADES